MEDITTYKFDFRTEVERLREDYAVLRDITWFFEVKITPAQTPRDQTFIDFLHEITGAAPPDYIKRAYTDAFEKHTHQKFRIDPTHSSFSLGASSLDMAPFSTAHHVCVREEEPFTAFGGDEMRDFLRLFTLLHESGHVQFNTAPTEASADAFAALHVLARFGDEAADMLSLIRWYRTAVMMKYGDINHLSTAMLDKIIFDSKQEDFSRLSPDDTLVRANEYARLYTLRPPEAVPPKESADVYRAVMLVAGNYPDKGNDLFKTLCETCLASSTDYAFYIGAKFFQPFLHPDGIEINGTPIRLDETLRQQIAAQLEARAARIDFNGMFPVVDLSAFAENAADITDPATRYLPVILPKGQKQLVVKL